MLKRRIFLGNSLLLLTLVGIITGILVFSAVQKNRQEVTKDYLSIANVMAGEIARLILWDDRVAVRQVIERQIETHHLIEYTFILLDGRPYIDSFGGAIPAGLLKPKVSQEKSYVWEFRDPAGAIYYDLVIPIVQTGAVLRLGIKRHRIDQQIYPALFTIAAIGFCAFLVGLFFSYRIAVRATREITLLCDAIQSYSGKNYETTNPDDTGTEVADLAQSFRTHVSERKRAEEELRHLQNYLSNIIDSMPSVLVGVNAAGKVTLWNKTAEQITGLTNDEVKGKNLAEVFPQMATEIEKINQSIQTRKIIKETKKPQQTKDGIRYDDVTIYPLVENGVEGAVIRIDDVSDKVKLEEQLTHSHKMDAIGQLAGGVAHDFNNMLSAIIGAAQLLKLSKRQLDEKSIKYVDMILKTVDRSADLTAQLLAFGRKGKFTSTAIDLHSIVDDTLAILNRTIDKKIKITVTKNAENHTVIGDNSQLQSALMNLCINASHAMPDGGEIYIETKNTSLNKAYCEIWPFDITPGEYVEIEVKDSGCGIPEEHLQKIFEPFFTTKEQGKGTGLGLAAVYGTIQDHHGAISVYSEIGTGTTFHIFLPCSEERVKPKHESVEIISGSGLILLVDDEDLIRIVGKKMLEEMGYDVLLAENGRKAVEIFRTKNAEIDLVILDMIMPEMNGREAFTEMIKIDPDCKVLMSSGFSKAENLEDLRELAGFIRKPYRDYELSYLIAETLKP